MTQLYTNLLKYATNSTFSVENREFFDKYSENFKNTQNFSKILRKFQKYSENFEKTEIFHFSFKIFQWNYVQKKPAYPMPRLFCHLLWSTAIFEIVAISVLKRSVSVNFWVSQKFSEQLVNFTKIFSILTKFPFKTTENFKDNAFHDWKYIKNVNFDWN